MVCAESIAGFASYRATECDAQKPFQGHYHLRFICITQDEISVCMLRKDRTLTASRMHLPNFSNSSLQLSLRTSVYIARTHLPYDDACVAHVVVEAYAKRRSGVVLAADASG